MIHKSLKLLGVLLNRHFEKIRISESGIVPADVVKLENIARLSDEELKNSNNVFLTLLNISEEFTMRNEPHYKNVGGQTKYSEPPLYLNLFVIFVSVMKNYESELRHLSHVIRYFQGNKIFTKKNSLHLVPIVNEFEVLENFRLIPELYSPTFEQANYVWSTLGGKQHPYVCYKVRLVEVDDDAINETRPLIKQIEMS